MSKKIEKLVASAKKGNKNSFDKLYELTSKEVWFTCVSLLKNQDNAEDIMQNTYLTAFLNLSNLEDDSKFSSWVKRIAVNKCKDFFKSKTEQHSDYEEIEKMGELMEIDELVIPEEYITKNEKRETILQLMGNTLSAFQYQTVIMYYFDNMSISEISEVFECSENTVKSRLNLARTKMKTAITDYETENNDKLHSIATVPLFSSIFEAQSKTLKVPKINLTLPANASQGGVSALSKGAESAMKATGKGFISTLKFKAIATVCAVALVSGGVATAVVLTNSDTAVENVATENPTVAEEVAEAITNSELTVDEDGNITDEEGNKLVADENGEVEVKTADGKTVKVNKETVKTVNKDNDTTTGNTSTEKKNTSTNTTSSKSSTSTSTSKSTSTSNTSKGSTTSSKTTSSSTNSSTSSKTSGTTSSKTSSNTNSNSNAGKTWHEAEYTYINHPAETQKVWVVDKASYTYEEPIYEEKARSICNTCGSDITDLLVNGDVSHGRNHVLNGENYSYSVKWMYFYYGTTNRVTDSAELYIIDRAGVLDGYDVKSNANNLEIVYRIIKVPEEGHWETKVVKEAWTEKVLVREAGWY